MENSEQSHTPLDLNSIKIFQKYTLAGYQHRAKFFPWVLRKMSGACNEESNIRYMIYQNGIELCFVPAL